MLLQKAQRVIMVSVIWEGYYRTVSWTTDALLVSDPSWELQAEVAAGVFVFCARERSRDEQPLSDIMRGSGGEWTRPC